MSHEEQKAAVDQFVAQYMLKGKNFVPARLQSVLAFLERLRPHPSLLLEDHLVQRGKGALISHEKWGAAAHERHKISPINDTHGRRSSNIQDWGNALLDLVKACGFESLSPDLRDSLLDALQLHFVALLQAIIDQDPITVPGRGLTAEAVIRELLKQASDKGKSGDVAQYLVGAKLMLRLSIELPIYPANKSDRKSVSDPDEKAGDFVIKNAVIEIAFGMPDEKHLGQIEDCLDSSDSEFWLLTREDRVGSWVTELSGRLDTKEMRRVVITSVEAFVGQNITELGEFSTDGKVSQLKKLLEIYNDKWVAKVGTPGIRVLLK
jgi:hypothetical protein